LQINANHVQFLPRETIMASILTFKGKIHELRKTSTNVVVLHIVPVFII
jgi:hypothetical protein